MGSLTVHVVGATAAMVVAGLAMGFSPTLYAVTLHELNRSPRAETMVRAMMLGFGLGSFVLLLALRSFDPSVLTGLVRGAVHAVLVRRWVDSGIGVVALGLAVWEWLRIRAPHERPMVDAAESSTRGPFGIFVFGLVSSGFSTNRLIVTYATGRVVTAATPLWELQLALYLVFVAALVGPFLLVAWAWERFPRASVVIQRGYDRVTGWDLRPAAVAGLALVGAAFLYVGIMDPLGW